MPKSVRRAVKVFGSARIAHHAFASVVCIAALLFTGCDQPTLTQGGTGSLPHNKPTSVTLSASPSPVRGGSVTVTATVTPSDAQGSVELGDVLGGSSINGPTLSSLLPVNNGIATVQATVGTKSDVFTSTVGIGTHILTAQASFLSPYADSTAAPLTLLVADPNAVCGLGPALAVFTLGSTSPPVGQSYTTTQQNQNAVCATGTSIVLENATLTGATGLTDYGDPAGIGAVLLAYSAPSVSQNSSITMTGGSITTNTGGQTPVVASGPGAQVNISGATISSATSFESTYRGIVMAAYNGGSISLADVTASSLGGNDSLFRVEDGSSIAVTGGTINVADGSGTLAELRGSGSLSSTNAALTGASDIEIDNGTAANQPANLSISGGTWSYIGGFDAPAISVMNASANITLTNVTLQPQTSSGTANPPLFLDVQNVSSPSFVPIINMTTVSQSFSGDIRFDATAAMNLSLTEGSQWTGAFDNFAATPGTIAMSLDANSVWNVTGDTALTTLADPAISASSVSNIVGNGHTVTYVAAQNSFLAGKTYTLAGGGTLKPAS